tara:strand:+ start:788 stop:1183 length:396 start_codon:yes stop_codon:yes gene_type:complete
MPFLYSLLIKSLINFLIFIKISILKTILLYPKVINSIMNKHYKKYKETIKKVARRHRLLKDKWITDLLMSNSCYHCSESELICLQFYPDDRKIRALSKKSDDKTEVMKYISNNKVVCRNCFQKLDSDIITN